eukprot:715353_1
MCLRSPIVVAICLCFVLNSSQTFYACKPSKDLDEVWEDGWHKKLGYYCDGEWPFYAGGFPPTPRQIRINTYWQVSNCITVINNSFCDNWSIAEYSNSHDFGSVNLHQEYCKCISATASYCNSWACRNIDN